MYACPTYFIDFFLTANIGVLNI